MPKRVTIHDLETGEAVSMWAVDAEAAVTNDPKRWSPSRKAKPAPAETARRPLVGAAAAAVKEKQERVAAAADEASGD